MRTANRRLRLALILLTAFAVWLVFQLPADAQELLEGETPGDVPFEFDWTDKGYLCGDGEILEVERGSFPAATVEPPASCPADPDFAWEDWEGVSPPIEEWAPPLEPIVVFDMPDLDPALSQRFGARSKGGDHCKWKCGTTTTTVAETTTTEATTTTSPTTTVPDTTTSTDPSTTSTTAAQTTTTTGDTTTTQASTTVTVEASSTTLGSDDTLPFTGPTPAKIMSLVASGIGLLILGGIALVEARRHR